ncbi:MAG: efflux RND transporter periplasmic adaptor subunit [Thermodesulfobacteriota bacterium]
MRIPAPARAFFIILILVLLCVHPAAALSQGPPPALVVVSQVKSGMITNRTEFVGTVYYRVVSDVAAEVSGKVVEVGFEEGDRVRKAGVLVRLDAGLLEKSIKSTRASFEQALAGLEKAELGFKRVKPLYERKLASGQAYDDSRLNVKVLEKKAASMEAALEGLRVELGKKSITAPFDGVVLRRYVDEGEWVAPGTRVAAVAEYGVLDVVVNVPEDVMRSVKTGMAVEVAAGGGKAQGKVTAVVPSGDVKTRTFPVKIRVKNDGSMAGGMDAKVSLPRGPKVSAFMVPRDALVSKFGSTVVFVVADGKAKMIPVQVAGYSGATAGVRGKGLAAGMKVVIKGNERLMDGFPVNVQGG